MTFGEMAWLDRWLGQPACFALTVLRRLRDVWRRRPISSHLPKKILFIKLIEQGATVLAYPAIHRAIEMVERDNVWFLVFEDNRAILDLMNLLPNGNVIVLRSSGLIAFACDLIRALRLIRRTNIDVVVDFELFARISAIIAYLTGAAVRIGLHRFTSEAPYRGDLMTHRVQYNPYLHASVAYSVMVDAIEADGRQTPLLKVRPRETSECLPLFHPAASQIALVERSLGIATSDHRRLIILNANASDQMPLRRWPASSFAELARRILAEVSDVAIVLTGAIGEIDAATALQREIGLGRVINIAGKTSMAELLTLYCMADVLVTNDSGPAHFASMTPIDCIVLFGPETPTLYAPLGSRVHVMWAGLACSPCVSALNHRVSPCKDNRCMAAIRVEAVDEKVRSILGDRRKRAEPGVEVRVLKNQFRDPNLAAESGSFL